MPRDKDDDTAAFVSEVCWNYYVNGMTQAEIGAAMGTTRLRVNQAIQRAKASGMVRIQIESPFLSRVEMQVALAEKLGIQQAIVAPANRQNYDYHQSVGAALASYLTQAAESGRFRRIGVSWGMTLQSAVSNLPRLDRADVEVISMIGGTTKGATFNSFSIASGLAERFGANWSLLAAPIFLSAEIDRDAFLSQEIFREHFSKFEALDAAVLTASDISDRSYLISACLPTEKHAKRLTEAGAIGDVVGRFLDRDGQSVANDLDARTVGVSLETLSAVPEKILAAAGPHKVEVIRAVARRGLATTLITDDVTAELLLG